MSNADYMLSEIFRIDSLARWIGAEGVQEFVPELTTPMRATSLRLEDGMLHGHAIVLHGKCYLVWLGVTFDWERLLVVSDVDVLVGQGEPGGKAPTMALIVGTNGVVRPYTEADCALLFPGQDRIRAGQLMMQLGSMGRS